MCVVLWGRRPSSLCLPDKGTVTIDAEIQLTVRLVQNSNQNHHKIQAQCSIIKIHASFQDLAVEEVESKKKNLFWKWKKKTSGIARDTVRALTLSGVSGHMTFLPRSRPNCPQKKSPRRVRQVQARTDRPDNLVSSESFVYSPSSKLLLLFIIQRR